MNVNEKNEWEELTDASAETAEMDPADAEMEESAQKAVLRKIWDSVGYLVIPVVSVLVLFGVVFSLAWVPTGSMEPTVPTRSHFIGWRLPYVVADPVPQRGEIVMFRSDELDELLVKRVIGLPGDTISLAGGYVYINGEKLEEDYLVEQGITWPTAGGEIFEVPENCIFVMGDNRMGSYDSRGWNNPYVEIEKIKSKALVGIAVLPQCTWRGVHLLK